MARRRYFRAELMWVFGICGECRRGDEKVTRIPRSKIRQCARCLGKHRRLEKERA